MNETQANYHDQPELKCCATCIKLFDPVDPHCWARDRYVSPTAICDLYERAEK